MALIKLNEIVNFVILILSFSKAATNLNPLWTWECRDEKCVPFKVTDEDKHPAQSLETCNMLCSSASSIILWPQPTGTVTLATTAVPIRVDLIQLGIDSSPSDLIQDYIRKAYELFIKNLHKLEEGANRGKDFTKLLVHFSVKSDMDHRMLLTTDESYLLKLDMTTNGYLASITANSFCGVRHGLETLSQLIWRDPYENSLYMLQFAYVEDSPKFHYRGLMLDTARNYFPVPDLLRTIDGMAANKMNTFHWHATDSQAFSVKFDNVPQLAEYVAYDRDNVYTSKDIRNVVHHARVQGIRVILEVDVPAHVGWAWTWEGTNLGNEMVHCLNEDSTSTYCNEPPCGQLNPHNPNIFYILNKIYAEIIELTEISDVFHLGGDDVSERCWAKQYSDTSPSSVWREFTQKALESLKNVTGQLPELTLLWASDFSERMKVDLKNYVHVLGLQARNIEWTREYISGIRTVLSHEDTWDLNSGMGNWYESNEGAPYNTWQRMYEHRPWARNTIWNILGGEATTWSSTLDYGGLDGRVWPRAAAVAERLWTDRPEGANRLVHARLDLHRSRLLARGINATPLWSMWCTHNTYTCD